jgi:hypothetical protein
VAGHRLQLNRSATQLKQILHLVRSAMGAHFSRIVQQEHPVFVVGSAPQPRSPVCGYNHLPEKSWAGASLSGASLDEFEWINLSLAGEAML